MKEVYPGIYLIREKGLFGPLKPSVNIYVLAGQDGSIWDSGYGNKRAVKRLVSKVRKIEQIYRTHGKRCQITRVFISHSHPDHFSGLKLLRQYLGVKIVLTKGTASIIKEKKAFSKHHRIPGDSLKNERWPGSRRLLEAGKYILAHLIYRPFFGLTLLADPDEIIDDRAEITINSERWKIFPSPGHASDHISLYNEKDGILFAGDNVIQSSTTWLGPPDSNLQDYLETLEHLLRLPRLKVIFSAHGRPVEQPRERIKKILKIRHQRLIEIKDLIEESKHGLTSNEVVRHLYKGEGRWKQKLARGIVFLMLEHLEERDQIRSEQFKREKKYFPYAS